YGGTVTGGVCTRSGSSVAASCGPAPRMAWCTCRKLSSRCCLKASTGDVLFARKRRSSRCSSLKVSCMQKLSRLTEVVRVQCAHGESGEDGRAPERHRELEASGDRAAGAAAEPRGRDREAEDRAGAAEAAAVRSLEREARCADRAA